MIPGKVFLWSGDTASRYQPRVDSGDRIVVAVGERVRAAREAAGLSQAAAAVAAKCDPRWWQRLEKGEANPTLRTLARIADALHVTVASLCGGDHERPAARPRSRRG